MSLNREDFAAQVYLRLMEQPGRDPNWLREEAIRQADAFIERMKSEQQQKRSRGVVNV